MRGKALITIVCTGIIVLFSWGIVVYSENDSCRYDVSNSTNDEIYENTIDEDIINEKDINIERKNYTQASRNTEINRDVKIDNSSYNKNTGTLLEEAKGNIYNYSDKIDEVVSITNAYRSEAGLKNLVIDKNLSIAASVRALEMAHTQRLSHIRPDGASCFIVLRDLGIKYTYAGENIGDGFRQSEGVCEAWKDSPSHYKNIVNGRYNKIGVGVAQSVDGRFYWVQIFSN